MRKALNLVDSETSGAFQELLLQGVELSEGCKGEFIEVFSVFPFLCLSLLPWPFPAHSQNWSHRMAQKLEGQGEWGTGPFFPCYLKNWRQEGTPDNLLFVISKIRGLRAGGGLVVVCLSRFGVWSWALTNGNNRNLNKIVSEKLRNGTLDREASVQSFLCLKTAKSSRN